MADELVLYTNPMSRGRIARWMLEEVGAPYRREVMGYGTSMKSADYLAINPMGKVPAIVHNGIVVTEGAAICAYLADAFPAAGLAPPTSDRGAYYRWLFFGAGPVEAATTNKALGWEADDGKERMVGYGRLGDVLDTLEGVLEKSPFIAGEKFTAADVYVGAQLGWGMQFGTIEKRPIFDAYYGKLAARPAAVRATQLDDGDVTEMQKPG